MIELDEYHLKEFISSIVEHYKTTRISKEDLLNFLCFKWGVKALTYKFLSGNILKFVINAIIFHNLGKLEGEFIILNSENPFISGLIDKYVTTK